MSWPDLSQMISIVRLRETESWPGPENNYSLLMLSRLLCGHRLGLELRLELEETLISQTQSWHDTSATLPQSSLPSLPPSPHTENTWKTQSRRWKCVYFFIDQIWSLQHTGLTGQSLPVSAVRCQKSFKFYLFCSIPGSGWWRLEEFLHEDLKIGGCKIKRYFKMCLPVFIGSIKASFGSAFWPPWSGGHFYNQPSKHDELSELETNFVVAGLEWAEIWLMTSDI